MRGWMFYQFKCQFLSLLVPIFRKFYHSKCSPRVFTTNFPLYKCSTKYSWYSPQILHCPLSYVYHEVHFYKGRWISKNLLPILTSIYFIVIRYKRFYSKIILLQMYHKDTYLKFSLYLRINFCI